MFFEQKVLMTPRTHTRIVLAICDSFWYNISEFDSGGMNE